MQRREFLALAAASAALASARPLKAIGAQLYTVRGILPKEPLETLRAIEKMGYREVEVTADNMDLIWPSLKQTALKPVSLHLPTSLSRRTRTRFPRRWKMPGRMASNTWSALMSLLRIVAVPM